MPDVLVVEHGVDDVGLQPAGGGGGGVGGRGGDAQVEGGARGGGVWRDDLREGHGGGAPGQWGDGRGPPALHQHLAQLCLEGVRPVGC